MSIVPRTRLLIAATLVFLPAAVLAAAAPESADYGVAACLAFGCFALQDVLVSRRALDGINIDLPAVLRASPGRIAELRFAVGKSQGSAERIRIGLPLPLGVLDGALSMDVDFSAADAPILLAWPMKALRQGRWTMRDCYVEAVSKWGFWGLRRRRPSATEIRIYPELQREHRQLAAMVRSRSFGVHVQRQVGKGREFEQLRDYLPGDSIDDIHWKASARRGAPVTKVHQIERTQQVYVIIDASRLSGRFVDPPQKGRGALETEDSTLQRTLLERYTAAGLALALAAERQGDHFGLLVHDDRIRRFVAAGKGKGHYGVCRDAIYHLKANLVSPDFKEVFTFIGGRLRRRALLVFLTSLDDPLLAESYAEAINVISRRHVVLTNMLKPKNVEPLFSSAGVEKLEDVYAKLAGHILWRRMAEVGKILQRRGVAFALLEDADLGPELVARYLAVKRRQIL